MTTIKESLEKLTQDIHDLVKQRVASENYDATLGALQFNIKQKKALDNKNLEALNDLPQLFTCHRNEQGQIECG